MQWDVKYHLSVSLARYPLSAIRYPLSAIRYPLSAMDHPSSTIVGISMDLSIHVREDCVISDSTIYVDSIPINTEEVPSNTFR